MTNEEYWYMLCTIPNIWSSQIKNILKHYETPKGFIDAKIEDIENASFLSKTELRSVFEQKNNYRRINELEKIKKTGVEFIYPEHPKFPKRLKSIEDCPYSLYVKGCLPDEKKYSVGMVGARNCSGYGREMTVKFAGNLAANGIQIISGMALGIDAFASKGALMVGGETFVVLGTGIDIIYPKENIELYYEIILKGGVISEFPPGTQGRPWQFPHRNRLISGLSDKLIIMEARKRSGSLTTAQHALNQNVDIYAMPGRITDVLSEGCNKLIADGCGSLINMEDFLVDLYSKKPYGIENSLCDNSDEYKDLLELSKYPQRKKTDNVLEKKLSEIYVRIGYSPISIQKLINESGIPYDEIITGISKLEIMGLIEEVSTDIYSRTL